MAMVINTNVQSLNAQRNLNISQNDQKTAMDRLTSGKRINSAADDAAGLQIASGLTSQIRGLDQAVRNANDGISMVQTAEGALQESTNMLQRMRELSIQSASGTFTEGNRSSLNAEVTQLKAELTRIAETTTFNGLNILDGSLGSTALQVGSESNQTINVDFGNQSFTAEKLGGGVSGDLMGSDITENAIVMAAGDVKINGQALGAYDGTDATQNVEDLVSAFNSVNGISASTYLEKVATSEGGGVLAGAEVMTLAAVLGDGTTQTFNIQDTESMEELVSKINSTTNGTVVASQNDDGFLVLASDSAISLTITDANSDGGAGLTGTTTEARLLLSSDDGEAIKIEGNNTDLNALGLNERSVSGEIEGVGITTATAWSAGDLTLNGVEVGAATSGSIVDKLAAINKAGAGVTATAFTSLEVDLVAADAELSINGIEIDITAAAGAVETSDEVDVIVGEINALSGTHGAKAFNQGGVLTIEFDGVMSFAKGADGAAVAAGANVPVGIKLASDTDGDISIAFKPTATNIGTQTGLLATNQSDGSAVGSAVSAIDISTAAGAQKAITTIDKALESINSARGEMGALTNRLNFTVNNLSGVSQAASASRSRIEDADFAQESANLSRAQVLQQAGTAMLAQANAAPQQVLSLLQ